MAQLPVASTGAYKLRWVTDDADCDAGTVDSGITLCQDTGTAWEPIGTGAGGSGDVADVGDCSAGACFQSETARFIFAAPAAGGVATFRAAVEADISDLAHTTDTGPSPDCSGTTTYQDGEGGCDDISTVYAAAAHASTHSDAGADEITAESLATSCTDGQILEASTGGWVCGADDAGASVPGSDTQVIFNDGGSLGADAGMTYAKATDALTIAGALNVKQGTAGAPSIVFPLDFGIYNPTGSEIRFASGGSDRWTISSVNIIASNAAGPQIVNLAGSLSLPNIIPNRSDTNSGFFCDGSDTCFMDAGGVAVVTADNDGTNTKATVTDIFRIEPRATAPATCTFGDTYMDSSGAFCGCNSSAAWELIHDLSNGGSPNCT